MRTKPAAMAQKKWWAMERRWYRNMAPDDEILSPQQLSEWLGIPISTVRDLCRTRSQKRDGRLALPFFRIGKRVRFNKTEVMSWLTKLEEAQARRN